MIPTPLPRTVTALANAALGVIVIAGLYWAQAVLMPVALAVFLTFLLAPVVATLQRWRLGRMPSVILTVVLTTLVLTAIGWAVTNQFTGLVKTLSQEGYSQHIRAKVLAVQRWAQGGVIDDLRNLIREVQKGAPDKAGTPPPAEPEPPPPPAIPEDRPVVPVAPESPVGLGRLPEVLAQAAEPLAQTALVVVLLIFMLLRREDLRNRLIRLIGHGRITVTTRAIDDAVGR